MFLFLAFKTINCFGPVLTRFAQVYFTNIRHTNSGAHYIVILVTEETRHYHISQNQIKMLSHANAALSKAICQNDIKKFYSILDHKDWPHNLTWSNYESLIFQCIRKDHKLMANLLVDKGFSVPQDKSKSDLLFQVAIKKFASFETWTDTFLKMLRKHNISVSRQNDMGDTMLHIAFMNDACDRLMDWFLQSYIGETGQNLVNTDGLSALHIACTRYEPEILQEFYKHGFNDFSIQIPFESNLVYAGYTPLHFAVDNGRREIVQFLLKHNADIYAQNKDLSTPLHLACKVKDMEMVDIILQADPITENYVDSSGLSHFMVACSGTESIIPKEYLRVAEIRYGTSEALLRGRVKAVDKCPFAGYTPLHFAAEFGRVDTVKLLLDAGLESSTLTHDRFTPLALAHQKRHLDVCRLLERHHDSLEKKASSSVSNG